MAFVTWVRISSLSENLLVLLQVPSFFNLSLYGCDSSHHSGPKRIIDRAVQKSSHLLMIRSPDHLQSPFTDSQTRSVSGLHSVLRAPVI